MTPDRQKLVGLGAAALVGTFLLKRSKLVRVAVASGLVGAAYMKRKGRDADWHEVPPPR